VLDSTNLEIVTYGGTNEKGQKFRKIAYKRSITATTIILDKRNIYLADLWQPMSVFTTFCSKKISNGHEIGDKYLNSCEDVEVVLRD